MDVIGPTYQWSKWVAVKQVMLHGLANCPQPSKRDTRNGS